MLSVSREKRRQDLRAGWVMAMCLLASVAGGCGGTKTVTSKAKSAQEAETARITAIDQDQTISAEEKKRRKDLIAKRSRADKPNSRETDADQR